MFFHGMNMSLIIDFGAPSPGHANSIRPWPYKGLFLFPRAHMCALFRLRNVFFTLGCPPRERVTSEFGLVRYGDLEECRVSALFETRGVLSVANLSNPAPTYAWRDRATRRASALWSPDCARSRKNILLLL
jgi:hypothetical protein